MHQVVRIQCLLAIVCFKNSLQSNIESNKRVCRHTSIPILKYFEKRELGLSISFCVVVFCDCCNCSDSALRRFPLLHQLP